MLDADLSRDLIESVKLLARESLLDIWSSEALSETEGDLPE